MIEVKKPSNEEVFEILLDDEIYDRIADDKSPDKEDFKINLNEYKNLGIFLKNKIIGLLMQEKNSYIHFQMLKPYRKEYASKGLKDCLKQLDSSVFCEIPSLYMDVIGFAEKHGFKRFSTEKKTYLKGGFLYDKIKFKLII